jgi:multiple sugar transport system substrate-binding protein
MNRKTFLLGSAASVAAAATPTLSAAAQDVRRASRAPVELKFTTWMGADEAKAFQQLLKVFEQRNPGITVKIVSVSGGTDYGRAKVETMIAANTPPDVLQLNTGQFEAFAARGALLDLGPYYKRDRIDTSIYVPGSMAGCTFNGRIYGTPRFISDVLMYYNKDVFAKAGVAFPKKGWTWYDFRTTARKLTDPKNHRWGFGMTNLVWNWQPFVAGNGGPIISADRTKCLMDDPRTIEALQFFYGLQSTDKVAPSPGDLPPAQQAWAGPPFVAGTVAMAILGPWERPALVAAKVPFKWDMAPIPVSPHTHRSGNVFYVDQWGVSAASNHPEEAWRLVKWLGSTDFHKRWLSAYGASSVDCVRSVDESPAWLHFGNSSGQIALDDLKNGSLPPVNYANGDQVENTWNQELSLVQLGQETAASAVKKLVPKINSILAQPA